MSDFQLYVKDIRWLFVHCKQAGIKPPEGAHCEAFAERVAIMLADGEMTEAEARRCALAGHRAEATYCRDGIPACQASDAANLADLEIWEERLTIARRCYKLAETQDGNSQA